MSYYPWILPRCLALSLIVLLSSLPAVAQERAFVRVEDGRFMIGNEPYYFLGANMWFGMHLGSEGPAGDRERLIRELDHLQSLGVNNIRVMASSEGPDDAPWRVTPSLQPAPGEFNEDLLEGLDFLLAEMARRDMRAVMVLNNFFQWSGGMSQYVAWSQGVGIPYPHLPENTWDEFQNFSARFYADAEAQRLFLNFVHRLVHRVNSITGVPYNEDPTIMSWQLGNEPRGFDHTLAYQEWVPKTAGILKLLAPKQLVSLGGEGKLTDLERTAFEEVSRTPHLDYLTIHIWIENWSWYDPQQPEETFYAAAGRAMGYMADHVAVAEELEKPIVLEEFGVSRDGRDYHTEASADYRDRFFIMVFDALHKLALEGSAMAGSNFWSWSGEGRPDEPGAYWSAGEPFTGDPPHEEQGWYSIYDIDESTLAIIRRYAERMNAVGNDN
ncbi:MAG: glycoside hydrolase 5 family protein [Bacteroidota bacterium]